MYDPIKIDTYIYLIKTCKEQILDNGFDQLWTKLVLENTGCYLFIYFNIT